jgi:lysophospholipase L1-like esterase
MNKDFLINFGLLLCTILLFFSLAEVLLRITGIQTTGFHPPRIYEASNDPRISYTLQPNMKKRAFRTLITTNSLGLRSAEPEEGKPIIAVLGDSITFGYGLEDDETLPARLQALLQDYNVQNGGVPGYFLPQEAALYEVTLAPLKPAALVLVFFFNDLSAEVAAVASPEGFIHPPDWAYSRPQCSPIEEGVFGFIPGRCWLDLHSATYGILKKLVTRRSTDVQLQEERIIAKEQPLGDPVTEEEFARYGEQLSTFARSLPPNLPRLFVIWPDHLLHTQSRPKIKALAKRHGFAVLDLYDIFGNEPETLPGDSIHPSPETAGEAAQALYNALTPLLPSS